MKDFADMTFEKKVARKRKIQKEWRDLERNNPEEYRRRVEAMQSTIDRYNSEFGIGNDENESPK
jgi:hypothetical protein